MADLSAPQQNSLRYLADLLRKREEIQGQMNPTMMGALMDLILPSSGFVEKLSYGDPLFRMPPSGTGGYIPITADKQYAAEAASYIPAVGPAAKTATRVSNQAADQLVRMITRNPQATAPGVIQETAMPFMQAVAPKTPGLLETPAKSDLGFYSALEQATMPLQNKGTGAQFLAQIEKTAGVKPEEVKWTGLDEFLKSRQNVTKQEVQDYLAANRVNLQEVQLGSLTPQAQALRDKSLSRYRMLTDNIATARQMAEEGALSQEESIRTISSLVAERNQLDATINDLNRFNTSKFSQYTLPGGENYREILLTLPTSGSGGKRVRVYTQDGTSAVQVMSDADIQRMAESGRRRFEVLDEVSPQGTFQSSHFDQPNILAHMRVNDRIVDGKKTLFIEEIQSDWHQAGRKKGYQRGKDLTPDQIDLRFIQSEVPPGADPSVYPGYYEAFDKNTGQFLGRHSGTLNREQAMRDAVMSANQFQTGVPDAPFKTTWHELTLKRAIQEASEKGYDQIAFTTGKTQAERYDLSKQIDSIKFNKMPDGNIFWTAYKDGQRMAGADSSPADLAGQVGKEVAEKMLAKDGPGELSGIDLQVGGEGMKGFYDNILPKSLEKLGKKFDAKVTKSKMSAGEDVVEPGIVAPGIGMEFAGKVTKAPEVEIWTMQITPKMRESVLTKGQPLFAATPAVGLLGRDEEE